MRPQQQRKRKVKKQPVDKVEADMRAGHARMDNESAAFITIRRRLVTTSTLSTSAGGFITANNVTTDSARGTADFASFQGRYLQFRVRAMRIRLVPLVDVTTALVSGTGAVTPHPTCLAFAAYRGGNTYTSYSSVLTGASGKFFNGRERVIEYIADWKNNPDAKLWCDTNAAIPTEQRFGIQFQDTGSAPASSASTPYYRVVTDYDVEFATPA
jgi:hypothetical protein